MWGGLDQTKFLDGLCCALLPWHSFVQLFCASTPNDIAHNIYLYILVDLYQAFLTFFTLEIYLISSCVYLHMMPSKLVHVIPNVGFAE